MHPRKGMSIEIMMIHENDRHKMHPRKRMSIEIYSVKSWYHHWMHPRKRMSIELVNQETQKKVAFCHLFCHI